MTQAALTHWIIASLLLGLRVAPVFTFAPPFDLVRIPRLFRVLFGLGLSICLVSAFPEATDLTDLSLHGLVFAAVRELLLGTMFVLAFQIAFGALYFAGRTLDIQAGFGIALLIDPATQGQTPLAGMLFAYAAGAVFFAVDGHIELLRVFGASLHAVPLGTWSMPDSIARVAAFMALMFTDALGVAGATMLVLFLIDVTIALLSRTVPQMNVLILGFQVKTIAFLLVLPVSFGLAGALLLRLMAATLENLPRIL
ncbi:MAG: flagellar biosynthetic protein FliR [Rhizomicrobium sp.]